MYMFLLKEKTLSGVTFTQVEFEKVADDLLMISIINDINDQSTVPSYWRLLGRGTYPPLEIGINCDKGTIKTLTIFVDSDCFDNLSIQDTGCIKGNIKIDTKVFNKKNDYIDIIGEYSVSLDGNRFICIFGMKQNIKETIYNDRIGFLTNTSSEFIGFIIDNLQNSEINVVESVR